METIEADDQAEASERPEEASTADLEAKLAELQGRLDTAAEVVSRLLDELQQGIEEDAIWHRAEETRDELAGVLELDAPWWAG